MSLLLASCGVGNKSVDNIESAAVDTIAAVSEIPAGVQEEIDSEPVIRIDTIPLEEIREALSIAMAQDSASEYNGEKYSHLRHMPDSLQNLLIHLQMDYDPRYREYTSTPEWECEIDRVPDSDNLAYKAYHDTTYYYLLDKFLIDVTNKNTQNRFRREITRDFAYDPDSLFSLPKINFDAHYCKIQSITPDTVKISANFCLIDQGVVRLVNISISKDGNSTITFEVNDN